MEGTSHFIRTMNTFFLCGPAIRQPDAVRRARGGMDKDAAPAWWCQFLLHLKRLLSEYVRYCHEYGTHLGLSKGPPSIEVTPPPLGGSILKIDSAGCIMVAWLPDPGQLIAHVFRTTLDLCRFSPKENLRAPQSNSRQVLFSILGTKRVAMSSAPMRFG